MSWLCVVLVKSHKNTIQIASPSLIKALGNIRMYGWAVQEMAQFYEGDTSTRIVLFSDFHAIYVLVLE